MPTPSVLEPLQLPSQPSRLVCVILIVRSRPGLSRRAFAQEPTVEDHRSVPLWVDGLPNCACQDPLALQSLSEQFDSLGQGI